MSYIRILAITLMELQAQKREIFGKAVKSLRKQGLIPAELYGHGINNIHLSVRESDFLKIFKTAGGSTVVNLEIEGEKRRQVLIHNVQFDPLSQKVENIDFYQVKMDEKIKVDVPLEFVGEAPAVKSLEAILVKAMRELAVEALPGNIPSKITVDLSGLTDLGKNIYIRDLPVPAGVKFLVDENTVVASVVEHAAEEVPAPEITVEEVKVESEEKRAAKSVEENQPES